jgi:hypothetical protein
VHFLHTGGVVRLYVDPRPPGATLPEALASHEWACLDIGLNLPKPIPDLDIGNWGVYGTLSFGGVPHLCAVGWDQIHAVKHVPSGAIVSWHATATAALIDPAPAPPTPRIPEPGLAPVIDFVEAGNRIRLARARKAHRGV